MRVALLMLLVGCSSASPAPTGKTAAVAPSSTAQGHGSSPHGDPMPHHRRFSKAEDWVERFEGPKRDSWQLPKEVIRVADVNEGHAVADIGTGTGYFVPHLSMAVGESGRVLALDIEADMIRYVGERIAKHKIGNARAKQIAPDDPGLGESSWDRILIVNTWHHMGNRRNYAKKLAAALNQNGALVIVDFTKESPIGPPQKHRLSPAQIADEISSAGLQAKVVEESLPHQYVVVARRK